MIAVGTVARWLRRFDTLVANHETHLTELDSHIGDADHGVNLVRGVHETLNALDAPTLQAQSKAIGMSLLRHVGGTSGPLLATLFLRMAAAFPVDAVEVNDTQFLEALRAGVDGLAQRGKTELGDKTMFDALSPAVATFEREHAAGTAFPEAAARAVAAAARGRDATADMVARKGRASYLGQRSVGHIDPGAASATLLFQALAEVLV